MPLFTKESLENLRRKVDLVEVLQGHLELKKTGSTYKALCPFHEEKTPSFIVHPDHHYHCFGCGAHGDAIQFLMENLGLSFSDAVQSLADRFHVPLEILEKDPHKGPSSKELYNVLNQAADFFHVWLLHTEEGEVALRYLAERGLDVDFIRRYRLGLAPKQRGLLTKGIKGNVELMKAAGLLRENGGDFFLHRVTFPIENAWGQVIGFSARKFEEDTFGGKYINTPETSLFKKSKILYGFSYSRKRIAKEKKAIIVEGQIDALRLIDAGLDVTVASLGTAFGTTHTEELIRLGVEEVYLAFDSDQAGIEAAKKVGDLFQKVGVGVFVMSLPPGQDPDLFIRKEGVSAWLSMMEKAADYLTFLVEKNMEGVELPAQKSQVIQRLVTQVKQWDHDVMIHESLKKLAQLLKVPETLLGSGHYVTVPVHYRREHPVGTIEINPDQIIEADILLWLLRLGPLNTDLVPKALELSEQYFKDSHCKALFQTIKGAYAKKEGVDYLSLAQQVPNEGVLSHILEKKVPLEKQELFEAALKKIKDRHLLEKREKIRQKLHSSTLTEEEAIELAKAFAELKSG